MENTNNQDKTKNILVALVIIVIIAGGLFFARKSKAPVVGDDVVAGDTDTTINNEDIVVGDDTATDTSVESDPNIKEEIAKAEANKVKFNTALTNSSTAFNARDYDKAISYLNEALTYRDIDLVYIRLFTAYGAKGDVAKAQTAINTAIEKNPSYTDYWVSKLEYLDQLTSTSYADLKKIYEEGLTKVEARTKINLVVAFAALAEKNKAYDDAITAWELAKTTLPESTSTYQAEIDRLKAL